MFFIKIMLKLDKKDKIIIYELDRNARQPLSRIAKKVNLTREAVLYRLNSLKNSGIIRKFLTVIDMAKLGYTHHKVYVKLHNITETQEKELINYLVNSPFISWVSNCDGKYSLIFAPKARSMVELNKIMKEINNKYWQFFMEQDVATIITAYHFYRDYLIGKQGAAERKIVWGGPAEETKLDSINIGILNELAEDSRVSAVAIANKLRISSDAVINRIKNLEKSGIIEHYMIWPDNLKMNQQYFKVLVTLHNTTEEKEKMIVSYCQQNPNIVYIVNSLGPWQLELDIEVKDIAEFRKLIREFLNKFSDIVSDYSALNVYEEYKFRFFDRKIFNYDENK